MPPIVATAWGYLFAIILLFPTSLPFTNPVTPFTWPTMTWVALMYTAYAAGFLGYTLLNSAAAHVWPSVVSIYITVQPVSSSLFGYIFLGVSCIIALAYRSLHRLINAHTIYRKN
jgi:drug/metabolite transporter (DMT)-like permease